MQPSIKTNRQQSHGAINQKEDVMQNTTTQDLTPTARVARWSARHRLVGDSRLGPSPSHRHVRL